MSEAPPRLAKLGREIKTTQPAAITAIGTQLACVRIAIRVATGRNAAVGIASEKLERSSLPCLSEHMVAHLALLVAVACFVMHDVPFHDTRSARSAIAR